MIKMKSKWKSLLYIINIEYNWIVSSSTNKTKGLDLYFLSQLQFDIEPKTSVDSMGFVVIIQTITDHSGTCSI